MKKSILTFFALSFWCLSVFGQGKISFEKGEHDFNKIKEDGGSAEYAFKFTNTGNKPLKLINVQASCGCTTPSWTKEEIQPKQTGFVKASYDPMNRPGIFNKTITVQTDGDPQTVYLTIKGDVTPRAKGPQDFYPMEMGNLRFRTTFVSFDQVFKTGKDTASTIIYNQGKEAIKLDLANTNFPAHLSLKADVEEKKKKKTAKLIFTYDASKMDDWGYVYEAIDLKTNDSQGTDKRISISADIQEDFSKTDLKNAPVISFDKTTHDFGAIGQNEVKKTVFTITNNGKTDLLIHKAKASCGCTATDPKKSLLKPNESTTIDVTYSSGTQEGSQKKSVTVISNDPKTPNMQLYIEANVQTTPTPAPVSEATTDIDLSKNTTPVITQNPTPVVENTVPDVPKVEQTPTPKIPDAYKIGEKVYMLQNGVLLTGFVEDMQGEKLKIRIVDLSKKRKLDYDGITLKENSIIWDAQNKWSLQKPN